MSIQVIDRIRVGGDRQNEKNGQTHRKTGRCPEGTHHNTHWPEGTRGKEDNSLTSANFEPEKNWWNRILASFSVSILTQVSPPVQHSPKTEKKYFENATQIWMYNVQSSTYTNMICISYFEITHCGTIGHGHHWFWWCFFFLIGNRPFMPLLGQISMGK